MNKISFANIMLKRGFIIDCLSLFVIFICSVLTPKLVSYNHFSTCEPARFAEGISGFRKKTNSEDMLA